MLPLALSFLLLGAAPLVDPPRAQLSVVRQAGAEGCADAEALALRVGSIAGSRVVTTTAPAPVRVDVLVIRNGERHEAILSVSGAQSGFRHLSDAGSDCRGLDEAMALTIALLLDAGAQPVATPAPPPPAPPRPPPEPAIVARPPSGDALRVRAELGAGVGVALLAKPVALGGLGAGIASRRFGLMLGVKVLQSDRVSDGRGYTDLNLSFAYLRACAAIAGRRESLVLDFCGGPLLGMLSGSGNGYDRDLDQRLSWLAGSVGARIEGTTTSPLSWHFSVQAVAPLARRSLSVTEAGEARELFHTRSVGALAELGLTVTL